MTTTTAVPKWLRVVGYPGWFFACLSFFLYLTFPLEMVKAPLIAGMEDALGKGKQGKYGVDPKVQIGKLSLWRLSGVQLEHVTLQLASDNPDPGAEIFLDDVAARIGLFSLLLNEPTIHFDATLFAGELSGSVTLSGDAKAEEEFLGHTFALLDGKAKDVASLTLDLDGIDVGQAPVVLKKLGVPATGVLGGKVEIELGQDPSKEAAGDIDLKLAGITLGPGELTIPLPGLVGGLSVPLVDMGDFEVKGAIKEGKATFTKVGNSGNDVKLDVDLSLVLNKNLKLSRLTGDGTFHISEQFLEQNAKFKTILDVTTPLKRARDDEGRFHFDLRGSLGKPKFSLSSSGGKSKKKAGRPPRPKKGQPAEPSEPAEGAE